MYIAIYLEHSSIHEVLSEPDIKATLARVNIHYSRKTRTKSRNDKVYHNHIYKLQITIEFENHQNQMFDHNVLNFHCL